MIRIARFVLIAIILAASVALLGCSSRTVVRGSKTVVHVDNTKPGPPPHAPAHGYRHKHENVVLIYDQGLGVYIVSGYKDVYFYRGHYYRLHNGVFQTAVKIDGQWDRAWDHLVPPGLQKKIAQNKKENEKNHGKKNKKH